MPAMEKILLLSIITALAFTVAAQHNHEESVRVFLSNNSQGTYYPGQQFFPVAPQQLKEIPGRIFLDEAFRDGVVLDRENKGGKALLRFNILANEVQISANGQVLALYPEKIKAARIHDMIFVPVSFLDDSGNQQVRYMELLVEGDPVLVKNYRCERRKTEIHPAVATANDWEYIVESDLFFQHEGLPAQKLKKNKKAVLEALGGNQSKLESYVKKNDLRFSREEDIIRLFQARGENGKS
jgi:hypothetical protein